MILFYLSDVLVLSPGFVTLEADLEFTVLIFRLSQSDFKQHNIPRAI